MLFVNGRPAPEEGPRISALDRGFTLGDGVFETMRAAGRRVYRWEAHLARLRAGALLLALPIDALDLPALLDDALARAALPQAVVRLTVSRGVDAGRGVAVPPGLRPTVVVRVLPLAPPPGEPARAIVATTRRDERSPLSRVKSLSYAGSVLARLEAQRRGVDDALLRNTRGTLAGATTSNLFAVLDGTLVTPPVRAGALPGTARAFVLTAAQGLGMPAREVDLRP
ncbi:MAG: aminotransferase class IV, partial [Chloroflexi bacterium]|nr:aminotransferase class IV [Chloroflexota bacterium]